LKTANAFKHIRRFGKHTEPSQMSYSKHKNQTQTPSIINCVNKNKTIVQSNLVKRQYRRLVTPHGGEWIRPIKWPHLFMVPRTHESAPKWHLDCFSHFSQLTCVGHTDHVCPTQTDKTHRLYYMQHL